MTPLTVSLPFLIVTFLKLTVTMLPETVSFRVPLVAVVNWPASR